MSEEEFRKEGVTIAAARSAAAMKANKDVNVVNCTINGDVSLDSVALRDQSKRHFHASQFSSNLNAKIWEKLNPIESRIFSTVAT